MNNNWEEQHLLDSNHSLNPQLGDYWQEMLMPVCVVLDVCEEAVVICKETIDIDNKWTWNLDKIVIKTRRDFCNDLHYDSKPMENKTWCHVSPRLHLWAVVARRKIRENETATRKI